MSHPVKGGSLVSVGVAADQNLMMAPPHEDIEVLKRSKALRQRGATNELSRLTGIRAAVAPQIGGRGAAGGKPANQQACCHQGTQTILFH